MKLSLTPKDMRTLLTMLYIAEHVLVMGNPDSLTGYRRRCAELLEKVLGYARETGCADLIEEDFDGSLALSPEIRDEPGVLEAFDDYEGELFWRELVERLAERDYELNTGEPAVPPAPEFPSEEPDFESDAREAELERLESSYWAEFEKHGVRRVHVVRGAGPPS